MRVPHKAVVLVANGRMMHMLRNQGTPDAPQLREERSAHHPNPRDRDQKSDAAGRVMSVQLGGGSSMEETDFHQLEEDRFAAEIADVLEREAEGDSFAALIVIAAPRTLGELRKHYGRQTGARLVTEVPADLTALSPHDLEQALAKLPD